MSCLTIILRMLDQHMTVMTVHTVACVLNFPRYFIFAYHLQLCFST